MGISVDLMVVNSNFLIYSLILLQCFGQADAEYIQLLP